MKYTKLLNTTLEKYKTNGAEDAYHYISKHANEVEGNHAQIYNFQYALAAASGHEDEALAIMKEAIIENGHWYSYTYLLEDEDLDSLRKNEEFQYMIDLCRNREEEAKKNAESTLEVIVPDKGRTKEGLFIALHGNQENNSFTKVNWQTVTSNGFVLGLPQSSQIEFSGGYNWDDLEKGSMELQTHYETMKQNVQVNHGPIILGGFSAGAGVILNTILKRDIPVQGFIFVGPWLPDLEQYADELAMMADKGIKGYIICGDQDEDSLDCTNTFIKLLEKKNVKHVFELVNELDHDYPEHFDRFLNKAIDYLTNHH
ncbi:MULTISPECIES: alpha/beta hydrolase [Bacillaceae]|uniref:Alpha/beta hydrolase n=1 Tax=Alkalicoccobacillus plakortidis TaxID=444060 RepID=A0A9D5HWU8_9BACI|nr:MULTISPECIES: alpha/beta hydrolase [Bacillaceae]KQL56013.1 alpha/beta hydrolase [Alkalicoccobacillus plakortidis]